MGHRTGCGCGCRPFDRASLRRPEHECCFPDNTGVDADLEYFSSVDCGGWQVSSKTVAQVASDKSVGGGVVVCAKFNSPHVQHLRHHPAAYRSMLRGFLRDTCGLPWAEAESAVDAKITSVVEPGTVQVASRATVQVASRATATAVPSPAKLSVFPAKSNDQVDVMLAMGPRGNATAARPAEAVATAAEESTVADGSGGRNNQVRTPCVAGHANVSGSPTCPSPSPTHPGNPCPRCSCRQPPRPRPLSSPRSPMAPCSTSRRCCRGGHRSPSP